MTRDAIAIPTRGHVVVCGLRGLGLRIVEELDRLSERVVVIDPSPDPRHRAALQRLHVPVIEADPADPESLRACGIPGARALVLTRDDDVANLHVGLAAASLDATIHVVMRAFDEEFGRRVESLVPGLVALSSSAIAAPGFVSALLAQGTDRRLDLLGRDIAIRESAPDDPSVIAVLADEHRSPVEVFPEGTDGGPRLCLVDASGDPARTVEPRRRHRAPWVGAPRPSMIRRVDRRFWVLTAVIAVLVVVAAVVFELLTGIDPLEAVYQAVKGVVGGADDSVQRTTELRWFALGLTIVGAIILAAFYGLIVDVIMSARVSNILGPHVGDARDHVIVIGFGSVGYRVAMALRERGVGVVAADPRPEPRWAEAARHRGIALVLGDARDPELLRTLRVDRARGLLAGTDDDAANLAAALRARPCARTCPSRCACSTRTSRRGSSPPSVASNHGAWTRSLRPPSRLPRSVGRCWRPSRWGCPGSSSWHACPSRSGPVRMAPRWRERRGVPRRWSEAAAASWPSSMGTRCRGDPPHPPG